MKFLRDIFDKVKPNFEKGGKYEKLYYPFEAFETLMFTPKTTAPQKGAHIRDAVDLKRLMMTVIVALVPCLIFGIWNTGHQHFIAIGEEADFMTKFLFGSKYVLPIVVVSYASGLGVEFLFAIFRKHPVNEGFLVTGMLIPLIMPATIPLWQVAVATIFSVVMVKEVFGGTGMNILNPALTARAFLYFAYPSQISGDVWTVLGDNAQTVEGYSGATALSIAYESGTGENTSNLIQAYGSFWQPDMFSIKSMFIGTIPGSIGETSTLMVLIGAVILLATGVGSWRIMLSMVLGVAAMAIGLNIIGANEYMNLPFYYHFVIGGLAFAIVFMATDPVSAAQTFAGKWIYGFLAGVLTVIIRVLNPAYPEGVMLAILLMNVFAPLIDFYVVDANKKRRLKRATV
ncbi:NADH:ubiquinone reductase (Na(+)-transporting) subunit B [Hyphobacterium sp. CCMP332]|nr:NADH:ubiquinone reductase (Na(+)-transporting) subunit B [Hyphobacterium sp. CCMP332]